MKRPKNSRKRGGSPIDPIRKTALLEQDTCLFASKEITAVRSSQQHGWHDLFVAHTLERPHERSPQPTPLFWLSMSLKDAEVRRSFASRNEFARLPAYSVVVAEPLTQIEYAIGNEMEAVHAFVRPSLLAEVANELFGVDSDQVSLLPVFGEKSTSLGWLLRSIKQSLAEPVHLSQLKIDYLARALCADLLTKYATRTLRPDGNTGACALTTRQVRRLNDYIRVHLGQDISVGELASLCAMGKTTFNRRFKSTLHVTPHQYVMRLRMEKAKEMLRDPALPLAEIGLACGFSDQAHLATLFKRMSGITPAAFRRIAA